MHRVVVTAARHAAGLVLVLLPACSSETPPAASAATARTAAVSPPPPAAGMPDRVALAFGGEVPDAMTDSTPLTVIIVVNAGRPRHVIGRASFEGHELIVSAPDGRIPEFETEAAAWDFVARVLPPARDSEEAARHAMLAQQSRGQPLAVDLDRVRAWAADPRPEAAGPEAVLTAWSVLAIAGELPSVPNPDPMGLAFTLNPPGGGQPSDSERLGASVMTLNWIVIDANRRSAREGGTQGPVAWPADTIAWKPADAARVAAALGPAAEIFLRRLSADVPGIERALSGRAR